MVPIPVNPPGERRIFSLKDERFGRSEDDARIFLPGIGYVNVKLNFIPVWIEDVETVSDGMIGHARYRNMLRLEFLESLFQVQVGIPDLEPDVIEAWVGSFRRRARIADLDQEKFVVGAAG